MKPKHLPKPVDAFAEFISFANHINEGTPLTDNKSDLTIVKPRPPKIHVSPITGKICDIRVSKSLLSKFLWKGEPYPICPLSTYHTQLLGDKRLPSSDSQKKGLYFESKCIGSSAGGEVTVDLPRHSRSGAKLADQERIDRAIERFQYVVKDYQMVVDPQYCQIQHEIPWMENKGTFDQRIIMEGTLDFISPITTPRYHFDVINVDLKLTKNKDICKAFDTGMNYKITPWGCPENMDFTEAMFYRELFEFPFMYLVFDFKATNAWFKDILITTDVNDPDFAKAQKAQLRKKELHQCIRWTVAEILRWEALGWPAEPSVVNCKSCPIWDCKKRNEVVEV